MRWSAYCVVAALLAACGGQKPPAATAPGASSSASPSPADSAAPAPAASAGAATPGASGDTGGSAADANASMQAQREPFMQGCMKKVAAPDYCQCGYEQFAEVFKGLDLSHERPDDEQRFQQLKERTMANCATKLPEDMVKAGFLQSCAGGDSRKDPYCQCAWTSLRKNLALADFLGDFEGPRFDDAKKKLVGVCKGKFPEVVAKNEFLGACTKGNDAASGTCSCIWKKLRARYSNEEIAAGLADMKTTPGVDKCVPQ